jgi:hypothetical protein
MDHLRLVLAAVVLASSLGHAARAALPAPPDQVAYSGVLGVPGPVDLVARIYDAPSGGTLVFRQSFTNVAVSDGHFTVNLGPTGEATDTPANPLTTSLRTALGGDLAAVPGRFVEITVNTDPPLARVQLVLVPYALRADHALTADVATQSLDTQAVGGLDGVALQALFQVYNDDGGPPSNDPREGTADPDGDGQVNFVDPDNDDDALSDSLEVANGSDINLVTPSVASLTPSLAEPDVTTPVTVAGSGFLPGLTAELGSQLLAPANVTPTSFDVVVGPDPGPHPAERDLTVTNPNGESTVRVAAFTFAFDQPTIDAVTPNEGPGDVMVPITVTGSNFLPGLTAQLGPDPLIPTNLTPTSFGALVRPRPGPYPIELDLTVSNPTGTSATLTAAYRVIDPSYPVVALPFALATATEPVSIVARGEELLVYGTQSSGNRYALDTVIDGNTAFNISYQLAGTVPSALGWSPTRVLHALRGHASTGQIQLLRDADGNSALPPAEAVALQSPGGSPRTQSPSLAFDSAGRVGGGYVANIGGVQTVMALHDRNGDNAFSGANELVTIEAGTGALDDLGEAAFDSAGRLAYAYWVGAGLRLAWDRSGDGDFDDTVGGVAELRTIAATTAGCLGLAFDTAGRLAIVNGQSVLRDLTGDADFNDAGEAIAIAGACDVTATSLGGRVAIAQVSGSSVRLLEDLSGDGDFGDAFENLLLLNGAAQPVAITETASGAVRVLTSQGVILGPVR